MIPELTSRNKEENIKGKLLNEQICNQNQREQKNKFFFLRINFNKNFLDKSMRYEWVKQNTPNERK